uniref:CSON001754 protein n=1 Tax=Culicoides sonorensis TaxID=179676 RepID=A0A336LV44_CULSO
MAKPAEIYKLIEKLCISIAGPEHKKQVQKGAVELLAGSSVSLSKKYDSNIDQRIWKHFYTRSQTKEATEFFDNYNKLKEFVDESNVKNILTFLYSLTDGHGISVDAINGNIQGAGDDLDKPKIFQIQNEMMSTFEVDQNKLTGSDAKFSHENGPRQSRSSTSNQSRSVSYRATAFLEQYELMQEVLFALIGTQGKILRKNVVTGEFKLDINKHKNIGMCEARMMLRIANVGYYYEQVKKYTRPNSGCFLRGLIGQGLVSALQKELTCYHGMVAHLQELLTYQHENVETEQDFLSLMQIMAWVYQPFDRLMWLSDIANACAKDMRGGQIASVVFAFTHHGSSIVKTIAKDLLISCCRPLQEMLIHWLVDGEIQDPHCEFFIEILPEVELDRLWHEKYRLQQKRLPAFITLDVANKIFVTGKSINFLREVCQDQNPIKTSEELQTAIHRDFAGLFEPYNDTKLHKMIDSVYLDTSKRVLDAILSQHSLIENLQALKNYLLLGQGDFIGLLMQNLKQELDRPAKELFQHDLHGIMSMALRASCAQFDEPEVLDNLTVKLMDPFEGDTGWDIFTLQYVVQGPLATLLRPSMDEYRIIFKPLWNMKRIEFVLFKVWREQLFSAKSLKKSGVASEVNKITSRLHLCTSEMIHCVHQIHYYTMFEVIECQWIDLLKNIHQSEALDDVLDAHHNFLETIKRELFLTECLSDLFIAMEAIFSAIMKLEKWQNKFFSLCQKEADARSKLESQITKSTRTGKFGVTSQQRLERDEEKRVFEASLFQLQKSLESICNEYNRYTSDFIYKLTDTQENSLQQFGIRLDFNEYYKKKDKNLHVPLTLEHIRQSSMFHSFTDSPSFRATQATSSMYSPDLFKNQQKP